MNFTAYLLFVRFVGNYCQGGRGQWVVYYTSPQSFMIVFSYSIAQQLWGLLLKFDWLVGWFIKFSVKTFQPLIVIVIIGNVHQFISHCLKIPIF